MSMVGGGGYTPIVGGASTGASQTAGTGYEASQGLNTVGIPGLTSMISKGGRLSPFMEANLASSTRRNLNMASADKAAMLKRAAYQGLGGPSGASSSGLNSIERGRQEQDTNAYESAMGQQAGLNLAATQGLAGIGQGYYGLSDKFLGTQLEGQQAKDAGGRFLLSSILNAAGTAAKAARGGK